jgi:hypothetical protein
MSQQVAGLYVQMQCAVVCLLSDVTCQILAKDNICRGPVTETLFGFNLHSAVLQCSLAWISH